MLVETKEERAKRLAREKTAAWRLANPERAKALSEKSRLKRKERWAEFLASERARYQANKEAKLAEQKARRDADPEKFRARVRSHYHRNKEQYPPRVALRRERRLNATPSWVDKKAVAAIYAEAKRLTLETGVPHEVDHIEPLKGRNSCGLHVPWNLQILTREQNRRKFTRHVGDHPSVPAT